MTPRLSVVCDRRHNCILTHTESVTPGYCVRALLLVIIGGADCILGDTCSSLVTSQRGFFVLTTNILLIAAHKPHRLLKDLDLIDTTFNKFSKILKSWKMHTLAETLGVHQNPDVHSGQTTFTCTAKIFKLFSVQQNLIIYWSKRKTKYCLLKYLGRLPKKKGEFLLPSIRGETCRSKAAGESPQRFSCAGASSWLHLPVDCSPSVGAAS